MDQFLIGMIAGFIYLKKQNTSLSLAAVILVIALAGLTIVLYLNKQAIPDFVTFSLTIEAILWSLVIYSYCTATFSINQRIDATLAYLGGLSFSMYLLHLPIYYILQRKLIPMDTNITMHLVKVILVVIPVTIMVSAITYAYVEKPFLKLRVRYVK